MDQLFIKSIAGSLSLLDIAVVISAVVILFVIAYFAGRKESDTGDFFLGNRKVPAVVACFSFVATEVSAVTIIGVPATAYSENWQYLQFFIGSAAARFFVAFLFIPVFYKYNCTTIYEFLKHRFNPQTQYAGSAFFFMTRLVGSGVRLYAACLAVSLIMGWSLAQTLLLFTIVSIIFIAFGGIKAVVWAGAYESLVFYAAGVALVVYIFSSLNLSASQIWHVAAESGRVSVFNFKFDLNDPTTFWAGTANAFFIGMAVFGTDQELVQRLLTVDTRKSSQKAIISTIFATLPLLCTYLAVGTFLFVFYKINTAAPAPVEAKSIMSHFASTILPSGLKGLVLAAVILASIDSPLASLSSSFVTDIYRPLIRKNASERHYLLVSRIGVVGFGIVLALIAFACQPIQSVLWFAFQVISITGGATLGIFLFGMLFNSVTTRAKLLAGVVLFAQLPFICLPGNTGQQFGMKLMAFAVVAMVVVWLMRRISLKVPVLANTLAMTCSSIAMAAVLLLSKYGYISLAWSWLIVLGTITTICLAIILADMQKS